MTHCTECHVQPMGLRVPWDSPGKDWDGVEGKLVSLIGLLGTTPVPVPAPVCYFVFMEENLIGILDQMHKIRKKKI